MLAGGNMLLTRLSGGQLARVVDNYALARAGVPPKMEKRGVKKGMLQKTGREQDTVCVCVRLWRARFTAAKKRGIRLLYRRRIGRSNHRAGA